jgi:hypothetical protein
MLFCTVADAAELVVALKEVKTGRESFFRVETDSLWVRRMQATNSQALAQITRYKIEKGRLVAGDKSLMKAQNILFQCNAGDADFVMVRQEHNSISNPLRVLSAFAGHPVQVSTIVLVKIRDGQVADRRELARRASSYEWSANIAQ